MTVPIIPAVVVFVLIIVAAAGFAVYKKKKGERFRSNSAKLSYIISVLLSILNMVILNLCKRVALLLFFSVSERRPTSCKYDFIVCYLYFPLWSDSLDLKHYLCNRYIFSLALTALDNNAEQLQLNQVKQTNAGLCTLQLNKNRVVFLILLYELDFCLLFNCFI